jgi:5-methylcytosine-specific restriction protein A
MALQTLKPKLAVLKTSQVKVLDTKAGATERTRGSAWMRIRHAVLLRDSYQCKQCGRVSKSNEVDHINPLERGGDGENMGNLQTLCKTCHDLKSKAEAKQRAGK